MKALVITGAFETAFREFPVPEIGPADVLLKVARVGLCGSDLNTYRGLNPLIAGPRIPGHEISARIVRTGAAVPERWQVGQLVTVSPYTSCGACPACRAGRPNCCQLNQTLGVQRDGALTEFIKVPFEKLFDASWLTPETAALVEPLTVGGHAADRSGVFEDSRVAVLGCGAVGLGAVLGAAAKGARQVIAIDLDERKLALAREFGATDVINSSESDLHAELARLTAGEGPDAVIEAVGLPSTFRAAVDEVAFAGSVTYIGYAKAPVEYETRLFVHKELDIRGSRNATPANFRRVIERAGRGLFPIGRMVSRIYRFDRAAEALRDWHANPAEVCRYLINMED